MQKESIWLKEEKDLIAPMVTAEVEGRLYKRKVAVTQAILDFVNTKRFPNTITHAIYEPIKCGYAFTPVTDGQSNRLATPEAKMKVDEAFSNKGTNFDCFYFYGSCRT
ncbi:cell wall hydrolase [Bacillus sp. AR18-7]|nr:cell wall hydrolase [Bacillus sp. AR18-7]TXR68225.1 cell wall hydrolase [Bacillus sp. AR18-7]